MFSKKSRHFLAKTSLVFFCFASSVAPVQAAPLVLNSSIGTGCTILFNSGNIYTNRYIATSNVNISAVNILIGSGATTNFSSSFVYLFSDNSAANIPGSVIETFTPNAVVGSGNTTVLNYVGNYQFSAGSRFWIIPSAPTSSLARCYTNSPNAANMVFAGVIPDTSTSNSNTIFRRAYNCCFALFSSPSWTTSDISQMWQLSIEGDAPQVSATIGILGGGLTATFRSSTTIRASVSAPAKVTFYSRKKVIPNCRNVQSTGGFADCVWKPSGIGVNQVFGEVTPIDSAYSKSISNQIEVLVRKRSSVR